VLLKRDKMSGEDLLTKFDDLVKRFRSEFNDIIEGERAKMKAELDAYNAEKQRMKAVEVSDNDIIHLNVGGHKLTTKRSTLCQVEGSLLASMFSGRWEDSLERDQFFDFNPQYFLVILEYLRAKKIATPENPAPLPKVAEDQAKSFNNLLGYLGLSDEIVPAEKVAAEKVPSEKFNQHSSTGVNIEEGGKVAINGPGRSYVLGGNVHQQGIVRLKMKLESFKDKHWMFIGMVKANVVPPDINSYQWRGSYGWGLGEKYGEVWKDGSHTIDNALKNVTKQGDTVELVLDCDAAKLSLHLPTGQQFHIEIPKSQTWRLNVNLLSANDRLRIMNKLSN
jgi:hypothetical protein